MKKLTLLAVAFATLSTSLVSCTSDEPAVSNQGNNVDKPYMATESVSVTASLPTGIKSRSVEGQFLGDGKEVNHFVWALYDAASGEVVESGEENCTAGQGSFSFKFQAVPGVQYRVFVCADSKSHHNINLISHEISRMRGTLYCTTKDDADLFLYLSDSFTSSDLNGSMNISLTRPFIQVVLVSKSTDAIPDDVKAKNLSTSVELLDRSGQTTVYNFWDDSWSGNAEPWYVSLSLDKTEVLPVKGFEDYQLISYGNFFASKDASKRQPIEAGIKWTVIGRDNVTYYSGSVKIPSEMVKQNTRVVITDANGGIFTDNVNVTASVSTAFDGESTF